MEKDLLSEFTGTFMDSQREAEFIEDAWPVYASSLRSPLLFLGGFIFLGGYLDFMWYGLSTHFSIFIALRLTISVSIILLVRQTYSEVKSRYFDLYIQAVQLLILAFWFAIFYDRVFLNDGGITSESFFTVLFVTYPFLVFYVIRGSIAYSLINSLLAFVVYLICLQLHPDAEIQFRVTEILVFTFFIYYSFVLQKQLNTEERKRFSGQQEQISALELAKTENEEKSRFIAATSHDLRQPLHALSLYMDILENTAVSSSDYDSAIRNTKASVSSLNDLLIALLDISKLDANAIEFNPKHFRLEDLLRKIFLTYESIAAAKGVKLKLLSRQIVVNTDPVMLERAIGNLVNNAIQHSRSSTVLLASRRRGTSASIEIWDRGMGIPENEIENIFTEYHRLENANSERRSGLGLGLAIVKRIAAALDYTLAVKSLPGKGSVFKLSVPTAEDIVIEPVIHEEVKPLSLTGKTIMIVDDEVEVRLAMKILVESWGCQTIIAESHSDLFDKIKLSCVPDIVVSDLNLPNNINGRALIENVRDFYSKEIPAMLITGDTTAQKNEIPGESNTLLLYKPLQAAQLRLALSRLI